MQLQLRRSERAAAWSLADEENTQATRPRSLNTLGNIQMQCDT